jgi:hypothetical protein
MRLIVLCAVTVFTLTSCAAPRVVPQPQVAPPVKTTPSTLPPPISKTATAQPSGHWTDWPIEAGVWSYAKDDRGSIARFGAVGKDAIVMLRCDKGRARLYLSRAATAGGSMTVRTSSTSKAVPMQPTGAPSPYVASELVVSDPMLDAMAFSRGRIALELPGAQNIAIPIWSEIGRVTEDCRN